MRQQLSRQAIAIIALVAMLTTLVACEQPTPGVTSEELRAAVREAIEQTQGNTGPSGPSAEEIEAIVHSAVEEATAQLQSTQMPAGPSAEDIKEIVYSAFDERVADIPSRDEMRAILETAVQERPGSSVVYGQCSARLNSCESGSFRNLADAGALYKWECVGGSGGATATCSFPKPEELVDCSVNASCGNELNSCREGFFADIDDTAEIYMWKCLGDTSVACSKSK